MTKNTMHDAEIVAVAIDRKNGQVRLHICHENGAASDLVFRGVLAFRVEDMGIQNVISRVLRSARDDLESVDLERWLAWVTSLSDSRSWLKDAVRIDWLDAIRSGRLEATIIEPSMGAQIGVVCSQIELIPRC